jgi:hypothetical protein
MVFVVLIENLLSDVLQKREFLSVEADNYDAAKDKFFDWTKEKRVATSNLEEDEDTLSGNFELPEAQVKAKRSVRFYLDNSGLNELK